MIDRLAILAEIQQWGAVPDQEEEDILLRDAYNLAGLSRGRAIRIFEGLIKRGALVERCVVITRKHRKVMAYRLGEGWTLDDLREAVKELA